MRVTADQLRAATAFDCAADVANNYPGEQAEYRTAAMSLGGHVRRNGLVATLAYYQKNPKVAWAQLLFKHISEAGIHGLTDDDPDEPPIFAIPRRARALARPDYLLATREMLRFALWLRRAAQATFPE
jgi:hypothetical protein